ncbi:hypothetical protein WISP_34660 [Willisornis vidua]|uniref:Uncharacterized protein n=1 Tax=Willisornis vidua TaxID=1566151 RepID=A0ABQ9DPR0_9PASS|nr:hypothetical protein WISP_34660 [Willisornis vidua]
MGMLLIIVRRKFVWSKLRWVEMGHNCGRQKKDLLKYVNSKKQPPNFIGHLHDKDAPLTDRDIDKAEMFNASFAFFFNTSDGLKRSQHPELENHGCDRDKPPVALDFCRACCFSWMYMSMGPDGIPVRPLKEQLVSLETQKRSVQATDRFTSSDRERNRYVQIRELLLKSFNPLNAGKACCPDEMNLREAGFSHSLHLTNLSSLAPIESLLIAKVIKEQEYFWANVIASEKNVRGYNDGSLPSLGSSNWRLPNDARDSILVLGLGNSGQRLSTAVMEGRQQPKEKELVVDDGKLSLFSLLFLVYFLAHN